MIRGLTAVGLFSASRLHGAMAVQSESGKKEDVRAVYAVSYRIEHVSCPFWSLACHSDLVTQQQLTNRAFIIGACLHWPRKAYWIWVSHASDPPDAAGGRNTNAASGLLHSLNRDPVALTQSPPSSSGPSTVPSACSNVSPATGRPVDNLMALQGEQQRSSSCPRM